ncbi:LCP family protein [Streptomyces sp. OfavH-34-F]|uniref:LCP family protein n=1 Tax=Streptomyces sp. OfavH-34-F TaxID=2917760 RepID=UPI001EF1F563|nr:LCP family protein [Streptomyces sp. OfavH-34-F]MCG7524959.1 LCP family protein [Streptomyces sp. OfavH-34-F]
MDDPADQWVLNPATGDYELRLNHSGGNTTRSTVPPAQRGPSDSPRRRNPSQSPSENASEGTPRRSAEVPRQGGRRSANGPRGPQHPAAGDTGHGRRKRKAPKSRGKKALLWTGGVMAFVLVGVSAGGYWLYQRLNGNINTVDIGDAGNKDVITANAPINILIIGTDKRTGKGNSGYGDKNSVGHADTNILFHVSEDRSNATAMSIPRDLITDIPECTSKQEDGSVKTIPGLQHVRFNRSLGEAGRDPGCTMKTVKELTGVEVDHFMMVDFNAVKTLSTAVGGVKICLDHAVNDPKSHLKLPAGENTVMGEDALAYVRTRHAYANESDLDRIKGQQQFIGSMIRQAKSDDTLTSPTKLFKLADAATKALTVDKAIGDVKKLSTLAKEITKTDTKNITFVTMPVIDNPDEPTPVTVVAHPTKADELFQMLREDTSLTEVAAQKKKAKSKQDALLKGTKAAPADVRVDVYNGGEVAGGAQQTVTWLQNTKGVLKSTNKANAPKKIAKTTLEYAPNQADQARALAEMMGLPGSAMKPGTTDAEELQPMVLTLGADFKEAGRSITGPKKIDIPKSSAESAGCSK